VTNAAPASVGRVLAAIADPTRRQVLEVLAAREPATATRLAGEMPVSRQAVVKHLAVLHAAGLVDGGRSGREVLYRVRPQNLQATARWMAALAAEWDSRLAAIKRAAEAGRASNTEPPSGAPRIGG
jgi:DNA-binding transcriptional ArsR family regulator